MKQDSERNLEMNNEDEFDGENNVNGNSQHNFPIDDEELDEADLELAGAEFSALNTAMDQLQAALDTLESRNAGIHEELLQLLQSNREIRMGLNAQQDEFGGNVNATESGGSTSELNPKNTESSSSVEPPKSEEGQAVSPPTSNKSDSTSFKNDTAEESIASQLARVNVSKNEAVPE